MVRMSNCINCLKYFDKVDCKNRISKCTSFKISKYLIMDNTSVVTTASKKDLRKVGLITLIEHLCKIQHLKF